MNTCLGKTGMPNRQKGIAIVELAIALPVMILMLLVTAEITRILYQYNTLTKVVRDGSRYMSAYTLDGGGLSGPSSEEIQKVKQLIVSGAPQGGAALLNGLSEDDITVTVDAVGTGGARREYVQITADYSYVPIFASIGGGGVIPEVPPFNITLTALSSMRVQ